MKNGTSAHQPQQLLLLPIPLLRTFGVYHFQQRVQGEAAGVTAKGPLVHHVAYRQHLLQQLGQLTARQHLVAGVHQPFRFERESVAVGLKI